MVKSTAQGYIFDMKKCKDCQGILPLESFAKQSKAPDGHKYICKLCDKSARRKRYEEKQEEIKKYYVDRRAESVAWLRSLKTQPCMDCGKNFPPEAMDYDHRPGTTKVDNVSRLALDCKNKEIILAEIDKCDLVCCLCHNERTHKRKTNNFITKATFNRNNKIINDSKNKPCNLCGEKYPHYNMQLDHIDPATKIKDVCQLKNRKEEVLRAEIAKCQVICALCHRLKSIKEQKIDQIREEKW